MIGGMNEARGVEDAAFEEELTPGLSHAALWMAWACVPIESGRENEAAFRAVCRRPMPASLGLAGLAESIDKNRTRRHTKTLPTRLATLRASAKVYCACAGGLDGCKNAAK